MGSYFFSGGFDALAIRVSSTVGGVFLFFFLAGTGWPTELPPRRESRTLWSWVLLSISCTKDASCLQLLLRFRQSIRKLMTFSPRSSVHLSSLSVCRSRECGVRVG